MYYVFLYSALLDIAKGLNFEHFVHTIPTVAAQSLLCTLKPVVSL